MLPPDDCEACRKADDKRKAVSLASYDLSGQIDRLERWRSRTDSVSKLRRMRLALKQLLDTHDVEE